MKDFIARDDNGAIVGKWRRNDPPTVPDEYDVEEVDNGTDWDVDYWWNETD